MELPWPEAGEAFLLLVGGTRTGRISWEVNYIQEFINLLLILGSKPGPPTQAIEVAQEWWSRLVKPRPRHRFARDPSPKRLIPPAFKLGFETCKLLIIKDVSLVDLVYVLADKVYRFQMSSQPIWSILGTRE